jgi:hypothetical protein
MRLLNFDVVPHLMSKAEAAAIFHEVEEANDADEAGLYMVHAVYPVSTIAPMK